MTEDQRFASERPDVLDLRDAAARRGLDHRRAGQGELNVSTTGTDSDFVVKLVDVYPGDYPQPATPEGQRPPPNYVKDGRLPAARARRAVPRQVPRELRAAGPVRAGQARAIEFELPDVYHAFRRGHRVMVQVQSSWFPLVDRNPQKFMEIPKAAAADFQKATQRVYRSRALNSSVTLMVERRARRRTGERSKPADEKLSQLYCPPSTMPGPHNFRRRLDNESARAGKFMGAHHSPRPRIHPQSRLSSSKGFMRSTSTAILKDYLRRGGETAFAHRRGLRLVRWSYGRVAETRSASRASLRRAASRRASACSLWAANGPEWVAAFFGCALAARSSCRSTSRARPTSSRACSRRRRRGSRSSAPRLNGAPPRSTPDAPRSKSWKRLCAPLAEPFESGDIGRRPRRDHLHVGHDGRAARRLSHAPKHPRQPRAARRGDAEVPALGAARASASLPLPAPAQPRLRPVHGRLRAAASRRRSHFQDSLNPSEIAGTIKRRRISVASPSRACSNLCASTSSVARLRAGRAEAAPRSIEGAGARTRSRRLWTFRRVHSTSAGSSGPSSRAARRSKRGRRVLASRGLRGRARVRHDGDGVAHHGQPPFQVGARLDRPRAARSGDEARRVGRDSRARRERLARLLARGRLTAVPLADGGWLRTGDLGERDEAGNIYFRGRKKDVIVTAAGLNVYPEDIEAALNRQPEVREAAVVGVEGARGPEPSPCSSCATRRQTPRRNRARQRNTRAASARATLARLARHRLPAHAHAQGSQARHTRKDSGRATRTA
jgi:hypothetical protein